MFQDITLQFLSSTQGCRGCVFYKRLHERTETCQKDLHACVFNFAILGTNKITWLLGDPQKWFASPAKIVKLLVRKVTFHNRDILARMILHTIFYTSTSFLN